MKTFDLFVSEEHKQAVRDGAEFVAVEWTESDTHCNGSVVHAGTESDCLSHLPVKLVVVPNGIKPHAAVWASSEIAGLIS